VLRSSSLLAQWPAGGDCPGRIAAEAERTSKIGVPPVRVSRIDDGTATLAPYPLRTDSHDDGSCAC
jgi:hypothetical protein